MASSLNRIFTKKIQPSEYEEDDFHGFDGSGGSETESISEEDEVDESESEEDGPVAKKRRTNKSGGGVAPDGAKLMRNPTRRPNPKVSNRNALLARENRRRKKEHVENLEKEVEDLKDCCGKMRKALKKRSKLVQQLTQERNYLKSVIANRSGIMAVLKSIQRAGLPMTSSSLSYVTEPMMKTPASSDEGFGSSPHPEDKFYPNHNDDEDDDLGTTMMNSAQHQDISFEDEFSRLPDVDELLSTMAGSSGTTCSSNNQVITTEHNYFEHSNHNSLESGPVGGGVCVHIVPGGRVSVEFCASCALSSQRAWLEDAEER